MINQPNQGLTVFPTIPVNETTIRLDGNLISAIPKTIGQAKLLTSIHLRNNQIEEIPSQIEELKNLQVLLLSNNKISQLPSEIGELSKITRLRLDGNFLTELPKEIGKLTNLAQLFLENNQISHFPEEMRNLTKLVHLSISGNPINIPTNIPTSQPQEIINYVLENQTSWIPKESLITRKAYYFINASKDSIVEKYSEVLNSFSIDNSVELKLLTNTKEISSDTNVVFIIAPLDVNENENLAANIAKKCKTKNIRFFILIQKGFIEKDFESVNLSKGELFEKISSSLNQSFPNETNYFNSYEEFNSFVLQALKQHKPNIRLTNLYLENIGHFTNLNISFDNALTCLIGENGTGKSTILRSLALAIVGHEHKKIDNKVKKSFLKIQNLLDESIQYEIGTIKLDYTIDGDKFYNELKFFPNDDGNDINISSSGDFEILYGKYNLKSLIIGFPQARGNDTIDENENNVGKVTQPHVNDLFPLINNTDDHRLKSFNSWITGLYFDLIRNKDDSKTKKEEVIISETFKIISRITKKQISFKTVTSIDPPEVWVTTYDSPNGIPMSMISQGFKIVIGWIGYFLQRFVNTFPLTSPELSFKENAILILDEVDTSIHPTWQSSFLDILRQTFPQTQFIFTTHSPLMLAGLNKEQFVELTYIDNEVVALKNQIDTWSYNYRDILQKLFDTTDPTPKLTIQELELKLSQARNQDEKDSILENIKRLHESELFEDETAKYSEQLKNKERELEKLIEHYKNKK